MSGYYRPTRVGPMMSADNVIFALQGRSSNSPEYVKAVIRSYIDIKVSRGKTKYEISYKLESLERELPAHALEFAAVRQQYGLPPSSVLRTRPSADVRRASSHTTATRPPPPSSPGVTRVATTSSRPRPGATTVRVTNDEDGEEAPPPYQPSDPEPEQTRMLEQRLAAEAQQTPIAQPQIFTPPSEPPPTRPSPPPPTRNSPPPSGRRTPPHDSAPSDEEERQVWEESQLDEAKRASRAAEREQQELEEAVRLSLAEAEANAYAESLQVGPSSRPDGSNANPQPTTTTSTPKASPAALDNRLAHPPIPTGSLMDDEDDMPTLMPLQPTRTGAVLQSNNPFLSPGEQHGHDHDSDSDDSDEHQYDPPPGPPPPHLRVPTPPRPLPRPPTVPNTPEMSVASSLPQQQFQPPALPPRPNQPISSAQTPAIHGFSQSLQASPPAKSPQADFTDRSSPFQMQAPATPPKPVVSPGLSSMINRPRAALETDADSLSVLKGFDTVFLVDDTASMSGTNWEQAQSALQGFADTAFKYDEDGVDIYFFHSKRSGQGLKNAADVVELFAGLVPREPEPSICRLEMILNNYLSRLERSSHTSPPLDGLANADQDIVKPLDLIVVTNGAFALPLMSRLRGALVSNGVQSNPKSAEEAEGVLVAAAKRLDRGGYPQSQVGIQFLQIGNNTAVREALQELDDGSADSFQMRHMVDTTMYSGESMTADFISKAMLGSINKRMDRLST